MNQRCPKVVVASRLPAPYREPLFQKISETGEVELHVLYQYRGRPGTAWGLQGTGVDERVSYSKEAFVEAPKAGLTGLKAFYWAWRRLRALRPDLVVIHGYSEWINWAGILYCWRRGVPYALRSDSNVNVRKGKGLKKKLKNALLQPLVAGAQSILYIGTTNRKYWSSFGATADQLIEARYAVDAAAYFPDGKLVRQDREVRFLFVGRFIPRKRLLCLIEAFRTFSAGRDDVRLTIVGAGPMEDQVRDAIGDCDRIDFLGRLSPGEMADVYRRHDVLVCPYQDEPWGLVINEAMSCGLAIIACTSGTCGAAVDLLVEGANGIGLREISADELRAAMESLANNSARVADMKRESLRIIEDWNYDSAVRGFITAAQRAAGSESIKTTSEPVVSNPT